MVAFISGLDRVLELWREMIAFLRSTSAARVQFDLIVSTLGAPGTAARSYFSAELSVMAAALKAGTI